LKGHVGLADILLEQPSVDINFRLDGGMTLVHMACSSSLEEGIVEQLEYLVVKKSADCTLMDDSNANAVHASLFFTWLRSLFFSSIFIHHSLKLFVRKEIRGIMISGFLELIKCSIVGTR